MWIGCQSKNNCNLETSAKKVRLILLFVMIGEFLIATFINCYLKYWSRVMRENQANALALADARLSRA